MAAEVSASVPTMLASQEQPPSKLTAEPRSGSFPYEPTYSGNVGNDMGISTMGYRSNKYNPPEWHESNYAKYYQSFAGRDNAERVRHDAKDVMKETEALTNKTQAESTKKLAERLKELLDDKTKTLWNIYDRSLIEKVSKDEKLSLLLLRCTWE